MTAPAAPVATPPFSLGGRPPEFTFSTKGLPPPAPLYIGPADRLFVQLSNIAGLTQNCALQGRQLLSTGQVVPFRYDFATAAQFVGSSTATLALGECVLLDLILTSNNALPRSYYVSVFIQRGDTAGQVLQATLLQGFVSQRVSLSWPQSSLEPAQGGQGWIHSYQIANPAAGAGWADSIPFVTRRRYHSFAFLYTASGVAANRVPIVEFVDAGGNILWLAPANNAIAAGNTYRLAYGMGVSPTFNAGIQFASYPLPDGLVLPQNGGARVVVAGIDVGDQLSQIFVVAEEWLDF